MKRSIVSKVFLSIMLILSLTLAIQLLVQMHFMDDLYRMIKTREMEDVFEQLTLAVDTEKGNERELLLNQYYEEVNSPSLILTADQVIANENFFELMNYIVVETESGSYKVLVGDRVDEEGRLIQEFKHFSKGNPVSLLGLRFKESSVVSLDAEVEGGLYDGLIEVKGQVIETHFINRTSGIFSNQPAKLIREVNLSLEEAVYRDIRGTFDFFESETGLILTMQIANLKDGSKLYALFTMEDLSQTFLVVNQYYIYLFAFQVLLLLFISYGYSRWITRPIKSLIEEAKDISELDFSTHKEIKTGDELEDLSKSLEEISKNMSNNIDQLKRDADEKAESEARMRMLLASLSHEFKTPLGIMSGFLEMMEVSDDNKAYYIETINEEIEKLNNLTKETLLLCESENHQVYHLNEVHSLEDICDTTRFAAQLEEKELKLEIALDALDVACDGQKIRLVMDNLISNAIKYSDNGASVRIRSELLDDLVTISIENTGVTFSEEDHRLIWEKYYRREQSRNKAYGGNGLGLAIVSNILKHHESNFGAYNGENSVIFYFSLKKYVG